MTNTIKGRAAVNGVLGYRNPPLNTGMKYVPRTEAYERLQMDGGWLSVAQLAMECGQTETTVDRNLRRQWKSGWLDHRVVDQGAGDPRDGYTVVGGPRKGRGRQRHNEYRARMDPNHWDQP